MTWQFILWAIVMAGIGAVSHALWTAGTRHAALRQKLEDKQEMQYLRQQAASAASNANGWRETAHRHEVEIAYLHGMAAGRNYAEERRLPESEKRDTVEAEGFVRRPPVGRAG